MQGVELIVAVRLGIASLIGLAAGLEREWSGHASGPTARFAGLRTFFLLGLTGGAAGAIAEASFSLLGAMLLFAAASFPVAAYVMTVRRPGIEPDGTTEASAIAVVALGTLAGIGMIGVAAGAGAIVVLLLREKQRLHWWVRRLEEPELRAGLQFAVLAVAVLPLLPSGPYLGALAVRPRALWAIVLVFSGLNFASFVARRLVGVSRGLGIAGALGGVVSSTLVTLTFSRQSRVDVKAGHSLANGVLAACTVLVPRVLVFSAAVNPPVAVALLPMLVPVFLVGVLLVLIGWRTDEHSEATPAPEENPLRLWAAIRMAVVFQAAMILIAVVVRHGGSSGIYATAIALGLTDVDALTVSMSRRDAALAIDLAARAIVLGILANTLLKAGVAALFGRATFRRRAITGLATLAATAAIGLLVA